MMAASSSLARLLLLLLVAALASAAALASPFPGPAAASGSLESLLASSLRSTDQLHASPAWLGSLLGVRPEETSAMNPHQVIRHMARRLVHLLGGEARAAERVAARRAAADADADADARAASSKYPYYAFLGVPLVGRAVPSTPPPAVVSWSAPCFRNTTLSAAPGADNSTVVVTLAGSDPSSLLCSDDYLLATLSSLGVQSLSTLGHRSVSVQWRLPAGATASEAFDLAHAGVRVFLLEDGLLGAVGSLIDTVLLFYDDVVGPGVPEWVAEENHRFLTTYMPYAAETLRPRPGPLDFNVSEADVHSGDFFGILRMDGLDPLLGWAMGSITGHTTVALREYEPDGPLYVTESTVKDDYWPVDGIQRTPWAVWVEQARAAGFNAVHAPLTEAARARFNVEAAWAHFNASEGLAYGYRNLLFGWLDTPDANWPCFPPDYSRCVSWDALEIVIGLIGRAAPSLPVFNQAMEHRLGLAGHNLSTADVFQVVAERGLDPRNVMAQVEMDEWDYNTTRYGKPAVGKSRVCCVWVASLWEAAGVFGDLPMQATEATNSDDYALDILSADQCPGADPGNPLCQFSGRYTLVLNGLASHKAYPHMNEHCPTQGPNYTRPDGC